MGRNMQIRSAVWLGKGKPKPVTSVAQEPGLVIDTETGEVLGDAGEEPGSAPAPTLRNASAPLAAEPLRPEPTASEPATTEPLPAQAIPPAPAPDIAAEVTDTEVLIAFGERRYRIRGLERNLSFAALKVNLLVSKPGLDNTPTVHVDSLDLYSAKVRGQYIKQAAAELGLQEEVIKRDLGQVLLKCEALQEQRLTGGKESQEKADAMSDAEQQAAVALLKAPDLMDRIVRDFARCGLVGESANLLTAYLAAVSRKLDQPLAILIQSTSAAGKSALMEAVLDLMPEEERVQYSAMTGQSLYYLGETELKHKILAIAEEEGMSEAAYALKLLQSQGELTIASTGKDPVSGELKTREYRVEGPVMIMLTTTAIEIDEELKNRCLVLTVNESREQTRRLLELIHDMVAEACEKQSMQQADFRFSRRQVREHIRWSDTALKVHLARLVELEYLLVHRGTRGNSFAYELRYQGEGEDGQAFLLGLLDTAELGRGREYDENRSGPEDERSGEQGFRPWSGQPPVRESSGDGQDRKTIPEPRQDKASSASNDNKPKKRITGSKNNGTSYRSGRSEPAPTTPAMLARGAEI